MTRMEVTAAGPWHAVKKAAVVVPVHIVCGAKNTIFSKFNVTCRVEALCPVESVKYVEFSRNVITI